MNVLGKAQPRNTLRAKFKVKWSSTSTAAHVLVTWCLIIQGNPFAFHLPSRYSRHLPLAVILATRAVNRRPLTAEARVRCQAGACSTPGEQVALTTGFYPSTSGFPCQCHCSIAPV